MTVLSGFEAGGWRLDWMQVGQEKWMQQDILKEELAGIKGSGIYVVWLLPEPSRQPFCLYVGDGKVSESLRTCLQDERVSRFLEKLRQKQEDTFSETWSLHVKWAEWPPNAGDVTKHRLAHFVTKRRVYQGLQATTDEAPEYSLLVVNLPDVPSVP